jgi:hypothetical protein
MTYTCGICGHKGDTHKELMDKYGWRFHYWRKCRDAMIPRMY